MSMKKGCILALVCLLLISTFASGLIQKFHVKDDHRRKFFLDNFGFEAGGSINLQIKNFQLNPPVAQAHVGFIIEKTQTDATRFLEDSSDHGECELGGETDLLITNFTESNLKYTIRDNEEGFYNIYFVKCVGSKHSFEIVVDLHNEGESGPIYLSAGMAPLTTVYSLLFIVYASIILAWTFGFMRGADKRVYLIHYLMTLLIILKSLSVLFKAIELHYLKLVGHAGTWAAIYYIFSFLKGIMMFVVVALVGTGWTFIKPFLAEKDKKVFLVVIPLQILDNIAMVVIEETAPGSQGWFTWKDIFRLVDIICCGAVLIPIIWSIKYLKEASQIDGKAARNMQKLKLFRQFYLIVVSYIYFTRIIVYLLDATLPFRWVWLGDLFTEAATLAFFCTTGYQFRPISNNPFLSLEDEDAEQDDEDLEDGSSVASSSSNSLPASSSGSVNSSN